MKCIRVPRTYLASRQLGLGFVLGTTLVCQGGTTSGPAMAQDRPAAPPSEAVAKLAGPTPEPRPFPDAVAVQVATERAPYDPTQIGRTVSFYEGQTRQNPLGVIAWRELAGAYLARHREKGTIADAVRAEDAARRSLTLSTRNNAGAAIRLAQALLAQHRFPEALAMAEAAARHDGRAARIVIDVRLELGDYDEAIRLLQALPTEPDDLNRLALEARFAAIRGRPAETLTLLRDAARLADERPDMPAEVVAWYHTMVGHHLIDAGQLDEGVAACEKALSIFPGDYRALTGLAEAANWRGDHASTLRRATAALDAAPENPEALKLARDAARSLGREDLAATHDRAWRDLAHSFPRIYDRHWALDCLDRGVDLDEALALARKDLELRHDSEAHDVLAWACYKKGELDEAGRESELAMAHGTQGIGTLEHAASIARARGDAHRADLLDVRIRAANPYVDRRRAPKAELEQITK